jgi:hypothetical protein
MLASNDFCRTTEGPVARSALVRRLAAIAVTIGAVQCLLAHVSSGRQVNQEVVKRKIVISEALMLEPSVAGIGAILSAGPDATYSGMSVFGSKNPRALQIGYTENESPFISLKSAQLNAVLDIRVVPPGIPTIHFGNRVPGAGLDLAIFEDGQPMAALEDAHGVRVRFFGPEPQDEQVGFAVCDKKGSQSMRLTHSNKLTNIAMFDDQGHVRTLLGRVAGKGPAILWYDPRRNRVLEMTDEPDGRPKIIINDQVARQSRTLK